MKLVLEWVKKQGGLAAVEKVNIAKKDLLTAPSTRNADYYKGTVEKASRSWSNVTMRLPTEALEDKFIADAKKEGLIGNERPPFPSAHPLLDLQRVSLDDIKKTVDFMERFRKAN